MNSFTVVVILSVIATVFGFQSGVSRSRSVTMMAEKSKSLPFLNRPAKLDGTQVGDFGFDPLGFTENIGNYNYVLASEIKHSRIAMLGVVGFIVQQYVHIVNPESNPLKAIAALGYGPNLQILSFIGAIELATWDQTYTSDKPGDFGFDPLGQLKGKSAAQVTDLKLKEINNGRLAMVAFIGILVEYLTFGKISV